MFVLSTAVVASHRVAIGRAFVVERGVAPRAVEACDRSALECFNEALAQSREQIESLACDSDIFEAHLEMIDDPMIAEAVAEGIEQGMDAAEAVRCACEQIVAMFEAIDDEYLRARKDDVRDIFARIEANLLGGVENPFEGVQQGDIVVDRELFPSDMALLDLNSIGGFVTALGSTTSHICIVARNHSLAAVVGVGEAVGQIATGQTVIVDGAQGRVVVEPDEATLALYREQMAQAEREAQLQGAVAHQSVSYRGKPIKVYANAGSVEDVERAVAAGADGIGLFRSEFLYISSAAEPTEQEQYEAYLAAARACQGRVLTIRTLDIGGDKAVPYLNFEREENPFLGWRAIRVSLECREMFHRQLRALLRASAHGSVRVMFPMISCLEELRQAKAELELCKGQLETEGLAFDRNIEVGVMIETPAAVLVADSLACECDFFSIGTNDLTQYIMAADRANSRVAKLYNPYSEAVLRAVEMTLDAADRADIECGMCGELASDSAATAMLADMGLSEFSVNVGAVAEIKWTISKL